VDNTSDVNKPVSTATQTELNLKAPINSPTFTGTVGGITKSMVGLSNVDNTSDANKPVSTATQTALNLKANLDSPALTGTPTAPTAAAGTDTTQIATTAFTLANRGDRYLTTSTSSHSITTGSKTFVVQSGLSYTPTQDVTIVYDASRHMHAIVTSYSGTTLVVNVDTVEGSGGPFTAWTINVGGLLTAQGALLEVNNLSDVSNPATALTNIGGVPTSRSISAGTGLTGGGDLTANRTLTVSYGTTSGTACQGNDSRLTDSRQPTLHGSTHHTGGTDAIAAHQINGQTIFSVTSVNYSADQTLPANRARQITISNSNAGGITVTLPTQAEGTLNGDTYIIVGGSTMSGPITVRSVANLSPLVYNTHVTITATGQQYRLRSGGGGGGSWVLIPVDTHTHTAADIDSESADAGYVLTADGDGGASWEEAGGVEIGTDEGQAQDARRGILTKGGFSEFEVDQGGVFNLKKLVGENGEVPFRIQAIDENDEQTIIAEALLGTRGPDAYLQGLSADFRIEQNGGGLANILMASAKLVDDLGFDEQGPYTATIDVQEQLTDDVTLTIPDQSGTIAVVTDIPTTAGDVGAVAAGAITSSGLTQATARILGRTTASTGAVEELAASDVRTFLNTDESTDTRDPNLHAASHLPSGSDELFDQSLNVADNVEFNKVTITGDEINGGSGAIHYRTYSEDPIINEATPYFAVESWDAITEERVGLAILGVRGTEGFVQALDTNFRIEQAGGGLASIQMVNAKLQDNENGNGHFATITADGELSDDVTLTIPDASGTIALQSEAYDFYYATAPSGATGGSGSAWVWNIPSWSTMQVITMIGAGGGGGSGRVGASGSVVGGGGGGGSGAYGTFTTRITGGDEIEVLVGAGGAGGAARGTAIGNGLVGTAGGNTSVRWVTPNITLRHGSAFGAGGAGGGGQNGILGANGTAGAAGTGATILGTSGSGATGNTGSLTGNAGGGSNNNSTQGGRAGGSIDATPTAFNGGTLAGSSFTDVRESFLLPNLSPKIGTGAKGGNASITANAQAGDNAGGLGGGGGGGGAALSGFLSGAGGNGGDGFVRIHCF
jgi:hypothetical protein